MSVNISQLDNQLTVVSDKKQDVQSVLVGVWVNVGSGREDSQVNGICHFIEHMAFKGTVNRSARQIVQEVESVGGYINAYTSRETTAYYIKVLKDDLPLAIDILADILQNSTFDEQEMTQERQVILQEIAQSQDTPDDCVFDHFQITALPDQSLGRPILGPNEIISQLSPDDLKKFVRKFYSPQRMTLSACGQVDHQELMALAQKKFTHLFDHIPQPEPNFEYKGGRAVIQKDIEQAHVMIGLPSLPYHDPRIYRLTALNTLLGAGMSSRLFQEVREKKGLAYCVHSFTSHYKNGGLMGVYSATSPQRVDELIPSLCQEIKNLTHTITPQELERTQNQMKASLLMGQESASNRCERIVSDLKVFQRYIPLEEKVQKIDQITLDDLHEQAHEIIHASSSPTLAILGAMPHKIPSIEDIEQMLQLN